MLSTEEFAKWSTKVVLFLHNTSHVAHEPYPNLLAEKGGIGFPTMSYLDAEGNLLKQVGHVTPVAELEKAYDELRTWTSLRAAVESGKATAKQETELFRLELAMGNRSYAEMTARYASLKIPADDKDAIDQQLVNLQFSEILRATPRAEQHLGGEKFLAMYREGRIPNTSTETSFWQYMFAFAAKQQDVPLFEELLGHVKKAKAGDARLERYLTSLEQQLTKLKADTGGK